MQRNIFVYAEEPRSGKSLISFSLLKLLRTLYPRVAFYRPVSKANNFNNDSHIYSAINHLGFNISFDKMQGPDISLVKQSIIDGDNKFQQAIFNKYQELHKNHDIIVCDGAVLPNNLAIGTNINLEIANNLNCEVLAVINFHNKTLSEIGENVESCCHALKSNGCRVMGLIINRALPIQIPALKELLSTKNIPYKIIGIIPENDMLSCPSMHDIQTLIGAEVISGTEKLCRIVRNKVVAAKHTKAFLKMNHTKEDSLIITPGDRDDILLSCILADQSQYYPRISGILLTAGIRPEDTIKQIISGIDNSPPILSTNMNTFEVAAKLHNAYYATTLSNKEKIEAGCKHILANIATETIKESLDAPDSRPTNKYMLQNHLLTLAQNKLRHIVFPEGDDIRVLLAAAKLVNLNAAKVTIIGDLEIIRKLSEEQNISLEGINIVNPIFFSELDRYAEHLYEKRKHKNMTINIAKDMITNRIMFGTCMVDIGDADAMVSGAVHTTSDTIRPALQLVKAKQDAPFVSSIFVMCMQNKVVIYGDCALSINPNAEQLAHIAESAAKMANLLNIDPKVALLSYSSGVSGQGSSVEKVRQAREILETKVPNLSIAGPIQYDAAVDPKIGKRKLPNNPVAGQANVLIFPDLDTGNNTYKAVQKEAKGLAIGPILLGLNKPINDLSRGCEPEEIFMTALITIVQIIENEE